MAGGLVADLLEGKNCSFPFGLVSARKGSRSVLFALAQDRERRRDMVGRVIRREASRVGSRHRQCCSAVVLQGRKGETTKVPLVDSLVQVVLRHRAPVLVKTKRRLVGKDSRLLLLLVLLLN